jgi:hypothetical protein
VKVVTIKFKVPSFNKEGRKWTRELFNHVHEELSMFDYSDYETPWQFILFNKEGKKTGKVLVESADKQSK